MLGSGMLPGPYGVWALPEKELLALPGYGKAADMKAQAKKLIAEAGFTPAESAQGRDRHARPSPSTWTWPRSSSTS